MQESSRRIFYRCSPSVASSTANLMLAIVHVVEEKIEVEEQDESIHLEFSEYEYFDSNVN